MYILAVVNGFVPQALLVSGFTSAASCLGGFASTAVAAIGGYPAKRNNSYVLDRDLTPKKRQQHIQIFMNLDRRKISGVMHKS